jgi:signal transducing adaptor molecule
MANKSFQVALEAATNESNTEENWDRILEVCDYVKNGQIKPNELLDQILKRLKQTRRTKLQMNTLILFDAAVKNCGQQFHQLFTSRATMNTLVEVVDDTRTENTVRNRIGSLLKQWMDDPEFKDKAQYAMLGATYKKLTTEKGYTFIDGPNNQPISTANPVVSTGARKTQDELLAKREEEEFAKAIALSMQEANQSKPQQQQQPVNNSLYPSMQQPTSTVASVNEKKAKALYDFEAAEDNEVTFKAGDILIITDDSDQHWWKGVNNGVEGLFPANFVTKNLQQQVDSPSQSTGKTSNDSNQKQQRQNEIVKDQVIIDERLIDRCLTMLQNADPTGEIEADSNEMLTLEDTCYAMGPLIDHELEKVDRKHVQLEELNKNLREAMDLYHRLMEEGRIRAAQAKTNAAQLANQMYQQSQLPPQPYYQVHPSLQPSQQPPMMYQPQQVYNQIPSQNQPSMPYIPQQQPPPGAYYVDPNLQQQQPPPHMMYSMPANMMTHHPQQQTTAHSETQ